jgi:hypothetical protein
MLWFRTCLLVISYLLLSPYSLAACSTFQLQQYAQISISNGINGLMAGDINGDGKADVMTASLKNTGSTPYTFIYFSDSQGVPGPANEHFANWTGSHTGSWRYSDGKFVETRKQIGLVHLAPGTGPIATPTK